MVVIQCGDSGCLKSISDDDLCAECHECQYHPGEMSGCAENWPGVEDEDGYIQTCEKFRRLNASIRQAKHFLSVVQDTETNS